MNKSFTTLEAAWTATSSPRPEVTDAELLSYMRGKLVRAQAERDKLDLDIWSLTAGIEVVEQRMAARTQSAGQEVGSVEAEGRDTNPPAPSIFGGDGLEARGL